MRIIVSTKTTNSGSPRIDGTRLTCANVAQTLWYTLSLNEYLDMYDYLSKSDILNCLAYCSQQKCVDDDVHSFCEQCTLDKRPRDPELAQKYDEFKADDFDADEVEDIWKLANQLLAKYATETTSDGDNVG
ncbi:DUF433 domain-containing protein [Gimesia aquarii]|uniref:DUF433 domain-containing protein n=1 Tax=Gimesia aquarii TaxID=2527964 RepID=A0A517VP87_9PLAN|nr:DUF433 domain-containing protein [Gimesia aquarii]QDT94819.1 hypothetical protein V144x_02510 [Gimesia aquarii]